MTIKLVAEIALSRIRPFVDGTNPWPLARLRLVEGGTSKGVAAIRFEYQADPSEPDQAALAIGMSPEQARVVADLLNEAADLAEQWQMGRSPGR